jgi:hypothetical protein
MSTVRSSACSKIAARSFAIVTESNTESPASPRVASDGLLTKTESIPTWSTRQKIVKGAIRAVPKIATRRKQLYPPRLKHGSLPPALMFSSKLLPSTL